MQDLQDQIVRRLVKVGRACAPDLANEIESHARPDDLIPVLQSMVAEGIVRTVEDSRARNKYQVIYELAP